MPAQEGVLSHTPMGSPRPSHAEFSETRTHATSGRRDKHAHRGCRGDGPKGPSCEALGPSGTGQQARPRRRAVQRDGSYRRGTRVRSAERSPRRAGRWLRRFFVACLCKEKSLQDRTLLHHATRVSIRVLPVGLRRCQMCVEQIFGSSGDTKNCKTQDRSRQQRLCPV
jgi:hypothetical protein